MITLNIKKGYDLNMEGEPSAELETLPGPTRVALVPERIRFLKPRLNVRVGDRVKVGSVLVEDKRNPAVKILSPGGGRVTEINFGPRRVIEAVVIEIEKEEPHETFPVIAEDRVENIERRELVDAIVSGGLWPLIKELPYRDMARPEVVPPSIFVTLGSLEPFQPKPEVYLKGNKSLFEFGVGVLRGLANGNVNICAGRHSQGVLNEFSNTVTHAYTGSYPAHDPGVLLYHTKKTDRENHAWFIDGQDLLLLAELLKTGKYPTERIFVLAGSSAGEGKHYKSRIGVPLRHLTMGRGDDDASRHVVGGIFTGYAGSNAAYMGLFEKSLLLVPEGDGVGDLFDWVMPGFQKASYSRTFLSHLNRAELTVNCNRHGGLRACISCNHCPRVCPVDILPQLTYKAVVAGEIEEALTHGLLDCVECGLCSYVCPSKIELSRTLRKAKEDFYGEMVSA